MALSLWYICKECATARASRALLQLHFDSSGHSKWRQSVDPPLHLSKLAPARKPAPYVKETRSGGFVGTVKYTADQFAEWLDELQHKLLN